MEVKRRAEYDYQTDNVIEFILRSRGVKKEDVADFLFPSSSLEPDWKELDNINEGVALLKKHVRGSSVRIVFDPDLDGYSSGSIMYQFLTQDLGMENVSSYIPTTKAHGINLDDALEHNPDLLIVPDAGSSEFHIHKQLKEAGMDILVIDHHLVDGNRYSEDALVINNQLSHKFKSKELTGAPLVYLFVKAYVETAGLSIHYEKYLDLAAIGMIADRGDMRDLGAFYYAQKGLRQIHSPLVQHIIEKSGNVSDTLTPKDVGFTIAPLINAMTREGKPEDIELVVDALSNKDYEVYNSRLKDDFHVVEEAYRKMNSTRNRQTKKVKEAMALIEARIEEKGTAENQVLLVNSTGIIEDSGLNGLVAIKLAEKYQRPTLVLQYNKETGELRGSGRNFNNSPLEDFKQVLEDTGCFNYAAGHANAFGVGIDGREAMQLIEVLNEQLEGIEYENLTHYADLEYSGAPEPKDIIEIAKHNHLWSNGLDAPVVHVHSIRMKRSDIKFIGSRETTWKLDLNSADGIMFNLTDDQKLSLTAHNSEDLLIEIVGECGINTFRGQERPQIMIKDFSVKSGDAAENPWTNFDTEALPF